MSACHILFISSSVKGRLRRTLEALKRSPVLTVGEGPEFCRSGGIIHLLVEGGKVQFEINEGAAAAGSLKISSQLLKLAKIVGAKGRGGGSP